MTKKNTVKVVFTNITAGFQLGITIFIFVYAGHKIDEYLIMSPVFLIIGTVFGFTAGFYNLLKDLSKTNIVEKNSSEEKQPDKWL